MRDLETLNSLLATYIDNTEDPVINFRLALYYHSINQTASAVSFYLRAAERTDDTLLIYECLLRAAICFNSQGSRNNSVEGMLQHAVALLPKRPEAYFHLARFYEKAEKWFNGYMIASIGIEVSEKNPERQLVTKVDYPGYWAIAFEKAVCSWWCGLCEESKNIFDYLIYNEPLQLDYRRVSIDNLQKLNAWPEEKHINTFYKTKEEEIEKSLTGLELYNSENTELKHTFTGSENISRNYSELFQDLFAISALDGKREGVYLDIGSSYPIFANNTYLLEKDFSWRGLSIDYQLKFTQKFLMHRDNPSFAFDILKIDIPFLLESTGFGLDLDYLSIDCGDAETSLQALTRILESGVKFKVLTIAHDSGLYPNSIAKDESRKILQRAGYTLFISDVSYNDTISQEDWWVDSSKVSTEFFKNFKNTYSSTKKANSIFIK
jgi:tetratricopeptide (TPR) repeat protein